MEPELRVGIGVSVQDDAVAAGRAAAEQAMAELAGAPALVIVTVSSRYDLAAVLRGIRECTEDTPLVGATHAGSFVRGLTQPADGGVGVLLLGAGPYRFGVASVDLLSYPDMRAAGQALARAAKAAVGPQRRGHAAVLLLSDTLAGDQQALVFGLHRILGAAVPIVGGAAGDTAFGAEARVLHGEQVLEHSAAAVWIDADRPLTVSWDHGWQPMGAPLMVTRVEGLVVKELNGRPAMEVLVEQLGRDGADPTQSLLADHPVGLLQPDGSFVARSWMVEGDELFALSPISLFAPVQALSATADELLDATERVVEAALVGGPARVLLGFSCFARYLRLGERVPEEGARLQAAAGGIPMFGWYSFGEFARTDSVAGHHNASLAALAL